VEDFISKTNAHVIFNMVGEGLEFETCRAYILEHQLSGHINLLGPLSQEQIKAVMALSDVFLYPGIIDNNGRCENQGLVIQEAQAMALPVLISDVGGMTEGIIDGQTGFVVKAHDIEGFAEKLEFLMIHPKEKHAMGQTGRQFVVDHYDNKILGKKLLKIYCK
jgi:colanic acid/amylovoran biosynthesis glycosyltransferase